jgi:hypothetical protein
MKCGNKKRFCYCVFRIGDEGSIFSNHVFRKGGGRCFCDHYGWERFAAKFFFVVTGLGKEVFFFVAGNG